MPETADLLFELGFEEIPAAYLITLWHKLQIALQKALMDAQLLEATTPTKDPLATPRRLSFIIPNVRTKQPAQSIQRRGPAVQQAYDAQGNPTCACLGFAKSCKVSLDQLTTITTPKGEYLNYQQHTPGKDARVILSDLIPDVLKTWVKSYGNIRRMRCCGRKDEKVETPYKCIRPVHWAVCMLGDVPIPGIPCFSVKTSTVTYGNRFAKGSVHFMGPQIDLSRIKNVSENHFEPYKARLASAQIMLSFQARYNHIFEKITPELNPSTRELAAYQEKKQAHELACATEWPTVLKGQFQKVFLKLPDFILKTIMWVHQRHVPQYDAADKLASCFCFVSNLSAQNRGDMTPIIRGNERVLAARLKDAQFFYAQDLKKLSKEKERALQDALQAVRLKQGLGTLGEKTARIKNLMQYLANNAIQFHNKIAKKKEDNPYHQYTYSENRRIIKNPRTLPQIAEAVATWSKVDLLSDMVRELPELQGQMGAHYAGEQAWFTDDENATAQAQATALKEHYRPIALTDNRIPHTELGKWLAIADGMDTLVGFLGLGECVSTSRDPYGLKRIAHRVVVNIAACKHPIDLNVLVGEVLQQYPNNLVFKLIQDGNASAPIFKFISYLRARFGAYMAEHFQISTDVFRAIWPSPERVSKQKIYNKQIQSILEVNPEYPCPIYMDDLKKRMDALATCKAQAAAKDTVLGLHNACKRLQAIVSKIRAKKWYGESEYPWDWIAYRDSKEGKHFPIKGLSAKRAWDLFQKHTDIDCLTTAYEKKLLTLCDPNNKSVEFHPPHDHSTICDRVAKTLDVHYTSIDHGYITDISPALVLNMQPGDLDAYDYYLCFYAYLGRCVSPAVHDFFDHVLVFDSDEKIRDNRLKLLHWILHHVFLRFGDFSQLELDALQEKPKI